MAGAPSKTLAMRALEARHIPYRALTYSPDVDGATEVARAIGLPPEQVYKTLVVQRDLDQGRSLLVMIASNREIDLRLLARVLGEKRLRMAAHRDAERLTGLRVGGISALALLNKPFDPCLDRPALDHQEIAVSAGQRGLNLLVPVAALREITNARIVDATGTVATET